MIEPANPAVTGVANGMISATVTGTDLQVSKSNAAYVSGTLAKHLLIRYRSDASGSCVLYFGSVAAPSFSGTPNMKTNGSLEPFLT